MDNSYFVADDDPEFLERLKQAGVELPQAPKPKGSFTGDIARGTGQVIGSFGTTAKDLGADRIGGAMERYGMGLAQRNPAEINTFADVVEKPLTTIREGAGEMLPQLPANIGAGLAGRVVGGAIGSLAGPAGTAVGQWVGGLGGAYLANLAQEYGGIRQEQAEQGIDKPGRALAAAAPAAALDFAIGPEGKVIKNVAKSGFKAGLKGAAEDVAKEGFFKSVGKGALQEGPLTEGPQTAMERWGAEKPLNTGEAWDEYAVASAKAAAGGGAMTGVMHPFGKRPQGEKPLTEDRPTNMLMPEGPPGTQGTLFDREQYINPSAPEREPDLGGQSTNAVEEYQARLAELQADRNELIALREYYKDSTAPDDLERRAHALVLQNRVEDQMETLASAYFGDDGAANAPNTRGLTPGAMPVQDPNQGTLDLFGTPGMRESTAARIAANRQRRDARVEGGVFPSEFGYGYDGYGMGNVESQGERIGASWQHDLLAKPTAAETNAAKNAAQRAATLSRIDEITASRDRVVRKQTPYSPPVSELVERGLAANAPVSPKHRYGATEGALDLSGVRVTPEEKEAADKLAEWERIYDKKNVLRKRLTNAEKAVLAQPKPVVSPVAVVPQRDDVTVARLPQGGATGASNTTIDLSAVRGAQPVGTPNPNARVENPFADASALRRITIKNRLGVELTDDEQAMLNRRDVAIEQVSGRRTRELGPRQGDLFGAPLDQETRNAAEETETAPELETETEMQRRVNDAAAVRDFAGQRELFDTDGNVTYDAGGNPWEGVDRTAEALAALRASPTRENLDIALRTAYAEGKLELRAAVSEVEHEKTLRDALQQGLIPKNKLLAVQKDSDKMESMRAKAQAELDVLASKKKPTAADKARMGALRTTITDADTYFANVSAMHDAVVAPAKQFSELRVMAARKNVGVNAVRVELEKTLARNQRNTLPKNFAYQYDTLDINEQRRDEIERQNLAQLDKLVKANGGVIAVTEADLLALGVLKEHVRYSVATHEIKLTDEPVPQFRLIAGQSVPIMQRVEAKKGDEGYDPARPFIAVQVEAPANVRAKTLNRDLLQITGVKNVTPRRDRGKKIAPSEKTAALAELTDIINTPGAGGQLVRMATMVARGITYDIIAEKLGVQKSTVSERLQSVGLTAEQLHDLQREVGLGDEVSLADLFGDGNGGEGFQISDSVAGNSGMENLSDVAAKWIKSAEAVIAKNGPESDGVLLTPIQAATLRAEIENAARDARRAEAEGKEQAEFEAEVESQDDLSEENREHDLRLEETRKDYVSMLAAVKQQRKDLMAEWKATQAEWVAQTKAITEALRGTKTLAEQKKAIKHLEQPPTPERQGELEHEYKQALKALNERIAERTLYLDELNEMRVDHEVYKALARRTFNEVGGEKRYAAWAAWEKRVAESNRAIEKRVTLGRLESQYDLMRESDGRLGSYQALVDAGVTDKETLEDAKVYWGALEGGAVAWEELNDAARATVLLATATYNRTVAELRNSQKNALFPIEMFKQQSGAALDTLEKSLRRVENAVKSGERISIAAAKAAGNISAEASGNYGPDGEIYSDHELGVGTGLGGLKQRTRAQQERVSSFRDLKRLFTKEAVAELESYGFSEDTLALIARAAPKENTLAWLKATLATYRKNYQAATSEADAVSAAVQQVEAQTGKKDTRSKVIHAEKKPAPLAAQKAVEVSKAAAEAPVQEKKPSRAMLPEERNQKRRDARAKKKAAENAARAEEKAAELADTVREIAERLNAKYEALPYVSSAEPGAIPRGTPVYYGNANRTAGTRASGTFLRMDGRNVVFTGDDGVTHTMPANAVRYDVDGTFASEAAENELGADDLQRTFGKVKTTGDALRLALSSLPMTSWEKMLARMLLRSNAVKSAGFSLSGDATQKYAGHYFSKRHAIVIHPKGGVHALLHEAVHAALHNRMEEDSTLKKSLMNLYLKAQQDMRRRGMGAALGENGIYGFRDVHEFVSEAFSNPDFQRILSQIESGSARAGSLWDRFVDLVLRALRLSPDNRSLLHDVLSVAGTAIEENLDAATATEEKGVPGAVAVMQRITDMFPDNRLNSGAWTNVKDAWHKFSPMWLTNTQLVERFGKVLPKLAEYVHHQQMADSTRQQIQADTQKVMVKWNALDKKTETALSKLMLDATTLKAHPDKAFTDPANAHLKPEDKKAHADLAADWNALPPAAKDTYHEARKVLDARWKQRNAAYTDTVNRMYNALIEKETDQKVKAKLARKRDKALAKYEKLMDGFKGPYFPMMRVGSYVVVGMSPKFAALKAALESATPESAEAIQDQIDSMESDPRHYSVSSYETAGEAEHAEKTLRLTEGFQTKRLKREDFYATLSPMTTHGFADLGSAIDESGFDAKTASKIKAMMTDLFISALPENSALSREAKRRTVHGVKAHEMQRTFAISGERDAFYISRLKHSTEMNDALVELQKEAKTKDNESPAGFKYEHLHEEMKARMALDMTFNDNPVQNALSTLSWAYHLGVSPAFVFINSTQPWLVTGPVLAGRFGLTAATDTLTKAAADAFKILKAARTDKSKPFGERMTQALDLSGLKSGERAMAENLIRRRILDIGMEHDLSTEAQGTNPALAKVQKVMGWATQQVELTNRLTTALAAYRLATNTGMTQEKAVEYAYDTTSQTQFDYNAGNTARVMREGGPVPMAKLIFQFRRYQQSMLYLIGKNFEAAFRGDKQEKEHARATLKYLFASQGMVAGTLGMPMAGVALALAGLGGDDDDEEGSPEVRLRNWLTQMVGKDAAMVLTDGIPTMFGVNLSKRIGTGDIASPFPMAKFSGTQGNSKNTVGQAMVNAAGAPANMAVGLLDAKQFFESGQWDKGVEKLAQFGGKWPADILRAHRFSTEGMTDRQGRVIVPADDFTGADIMLRAAGFAPTRESSYYLANNAKLDVTTAIRDRRTALLNRLAARAERGETISSLVKDDEVVEFNAKHDRHGAYGRVTAGDVQKKVIADKKIPRQRDASGVRYTDAERDFQGLTEFAR